MAGSRLAGVRVHACAKLNLTLRVLGRRDDGYHELRTVYQSVALHDTITLRSSPGDFRISCNDPACPADRSNLVWRAADAVWHASGRRGRPHGVVAHLVKRIPMQAGLGGGSTDAAAAIRALAVLWRITLTPAQVRSIAAGLGADVPFFLEGGSALGLGRGDLLFPLADRPPAWVVLALPSFGVSTRDAYAWWDVATGNGSPRRAGPGAKSGAAVDFATGGLPADELRNDLQPVVAARYPQIARLAGALRLHGAAYAGMSGSGSAVFGLFDSPRRAAAACRSVGVLAHRVLLTRTLGRAGYRARARVREC